MNIFKIKLKIYILCMYIITSNTFYLIISGLLVHMRNKFHWGRLKLLKQLFPWFSIINLR